MGYLPGKIEIVTKLVDRVHCGREKTYKYCYLSEKTEISYFSSICIQNELTISPHKFLLPAVYFPISIGTQSCTMNVGTL
jgi:hypothetical protein